MKKASITDAKNNLRALIDGLKDGSPVLIVDRGRPVARLEPVTSGPRSGDDSRLTKLVRDGIVRPARAPVPKALFATKPPRPKGGASMSTIGHVERTTPQRVVYATSTGATS